MQGDCINYNYYLSKKLTKKPKTKDVSHPCCSKNMSFLIECEVIPVCTQCRDNCDKKFCETPQPSWQSRM